MKIKFRDTRTALKRCSYTVAVMLSVAIWSADAQAQAAFPSAEVKWTGGSGIAELHIDGDTAEVTLRGSGGKLSQLRPIDTVDDALAILADERLSFAWPALLAWAGDDLHILRDKALNRAERAAHQAVQPLPVEGRAKMEGWNKHFRAFRQYMSALERSGRTSDAIAKIQAEIASPTLGDNHLVRSQLQIMLAHLLFVDGATIRAIAVLEQASANAPSNAAKQNVNANFALLLARIGQYDRALKINDATEQEFDQLGSGILVGHRKLPDSDAYFEAIRACALSGLGRHDEAQATLVKIPSEPATTSKLSVKAEARLLAFSCMHDAVGLANEIAADIRTAPPAAQVLLEIQPIREAFPAERETLVAAIAKEVAIKAMAGNARVLSGDLVPALSSWRNASAIPAQ